MLRGRVASSHPFNTILCAFLLMNSIPFRSNTHWNVKHLGFTWKQISLIFLSIRFSFGKYFKYPGSDMDHHRVKLCRRHCKRLHLLSFFWSHDQATWVIWNLCLSVVATRCHSFFTQKKSYSPGRITSLPNISKPVWFYWKSHCPGIAKLCETAPKSLPGEDIPCWHKKRTRALSFAAHFCGSPQPYVSYVRRYLMTALHYKAQCVHYDR